MRCPNKEYYGDTPSCGCGHMCTIRSVATMLVVLYILKQMKML